MNASLRTPLGRVRGKGSAKSGTGHFIAQRVSAIALLLLAPYLFISAALNIYPGFEGAFVWVVQPIVAAPLLLFLFCALYHMRIGMQVVIEDYIEKPLTKALLLLINTFVVLAAATAGAFAILSIAFGG